jgi:outer membrane protein insertion porin family
MSLKKIQILLISFIVIFTTLASYADDFVVRKIRIEGLQRVSETTVREYLPIHQGEVLDSTKTGEVIRALYDTGFFSDVQLSRDGDTLIINVMERATIGLIRIKGNREIKTKDLMDALKQAGIAEGLAYDQGTLSEMRQALEEQYYNLGRYNASVTTSVTRESRNRVSILININEGQVARVQQINIIGNHAFSDHKLLQNFQMTTHHFWSFFKGNDHYSREKLETDLESLRTFYLDRGYLHFSIDSTEVSVTPNRKDVYITIHVTEGGVYHIKGYRIAGNTLGQADRLPPLVRVKPGQIFSRRDIEATNNAIGRFYENEGYASATVTVIPDIDETTKEVFLTFQVNPGPRTYVRRINFIGNTKTADYVLRRESRQMEGGLFSISNVDESKRRLNMLGYLENVQVKMDPVPTQPNMLDLNYTVKETSSATANAQIGYSDSYGFMYGSNISQRNFLGSGKSVTVGFNNSQYMQSYNFSYFNPYYTESGISRGFNAYVQRVTPDEVNLATYTQNIYGLGFNYRLPMSEYDYFTFGYGYEYTQLGSSNPSNVVADFFNEEGTHFNNLKLNAGWTHNTYDRAIFPTKGLNVVFSGELGTPLLPDSLDYYKLSLDGRYYQPLTHGFIAMMSTSWGYGNGYNGFDTLPFFKNFYAGGMGTVRGYQSNSLGPRDSQGNAVGGNVFADGSFNLIVPNPLGTKVRTSAFVDAGNVFQQQLDFGEIRYSTGVELDWWSPMGPLRFSIAKALNPHSDSTQGFPHEDDTQSFNFSVGTSV